MPNSTAYSAIEDLLIGDLIISETLDRQKFVDDAADEIDSKLGWIYQTPIVLTGLPRHEALLLKSINNRLASGRLLLTLYQSGENNSVHAYAASLVRDATNDLMLIANGDVVLSAPRQENTTQGTSDTAPTATGMDEIGPMTAFEEAFMTGGWPVRNEPWVPGV